MKTRNESWGFYGTIMSNSSYRIPKAAAAKMFAAMVNKIAFRLNITKELARDYLDSRCGRHLADAVCDQYGKPTLELPSWLGKDFYRFEKEYDAAEFAASL